MGGHLAGVRVDAKKLARRQVMDRDSDSCRLVVVGRRLPSALVAIALAAFAFACNSGSAHDPGAAASGEPATVGSASAAPAASVDPAVLAYAGTDREPPTAATKPQKGKKVWIISPSQIGESASVATNAAKEAGELVGWKMTLFDAKGDPAAFSAGIRQAIAAKADGIILHAIDCAWV